MWDVLLNEAHIEQCDVAVEGLKDKPGQGRPKRGLGVLGFRVWRFRGSGFRV